MLWGPKTKVIWSQILKMLILRSQIADIGWEYVKIKEKIVPKSDKFDK